MDKLSREKVHYWGRTRNELISAGRWVEVHSRDITRFTMASFHDGQWLAEKFSTLNALAQFLLPSDDSNANE